MAGMKLERIIFPSPPVVHSKHVVTLTEEERTGLHKLISTGRSAARTLAHARVLLHTDAGPGGSRWTDEQIQEALAVSLTTIARIRRAFVEQGLDAALHRRPHPPRPRKLDGRAEAHLLALACSAPPNGQARWSLQLLTDRFVELAVSPPVSDETVRRTLKQTHSSRG
jgi:transposase